MNKMWEKRFMELAQFYAQWSKDPSTKVGAVIVDHELRPVGMGYNGFPRGVNDDQARYEEKMVKYKLIVHSEANAILNSVKSVLGLTIFTTKYPCSDCTKLIIQSGIARVITPPPGVTEPWAEDAKFSAQMLKEAGVLVRHYEGE